MKMQTINGYQSMKYSHFKWMNKREFSLRRLLRMRSTRTTFLVGGRGVVWFCHHNEYLFDAGKWIHARRRLWKMKSDKVWIRRFKRYSPMDWDCYWAFSDWNQTWLRPTWENLFSRGETNNQVLSRLPASVFTTMLTYFVDAKTQGRYS